MSTQTRDHVPAWDVADRMRKSLRDADVSVSVMADYLEVSRNTVGNYINGHTTPPGAILRLWAMRCGVDLEWLKHGFPTEPGATGDPTTTGTTRGRFADSQQLLDPVLEAA